MRNPLDEIGMPPYDRHRAAEDLQRHNGYNLSGVGRATYLPYLPGMVRGDSGARPIGRIRTVAGLPYIPNYRGEAPLSMQPQIPLAYPWQNGGTVATE